MPSGRWSAALAALAFACSIPLTATAAPGQLYAGTLITSKLNSTVDSGSAAKNDAFTMTVVAPFPSNNSAYEKAQLHGHVTNVVPAGQGRNAQLEFNIDRIVLADGRHADVRVAVQSQETQQHNNVSNIALSAVGGMIIGNMIGKTVFKSNIGGAVGLIAGALYANNKRTNVSLRQGPTVVVEVLRTVALVRSNKVASRQRLTTIASARCRPKVVHDAL